MNKVIFLLLSIPIGLIIWLSQVNKADEEQDKHTPTGRMEFEINRLADPATGEIPPFIRQKEMKLYNKLAAEKHLDKSGSQDFAHVGPYNVGGRTRALAIDVSNPNVYFAGAVSGGIWRSVDAGATWTKVSHPSSHAAVSCIAQDTRTGKRNTLYYGSGESIGNSASKSFSAYYRGSGMYKSTDGGLTWNKIASTATQVNKASNWDFIHAIALDASRNDSDIIYAALKRGIFRSNDGGTTWSNVIPTTQDASFSHVMVSSTGIVYASISSNGGNNGGFWRSENGLTWKKITSPSFPITHVRTVFDIAPSNENILYFFSGTPGTGANGASLWKYQYLSGDGSGSGGAWTNLSPNIPDSNLNLFNGYCMVVKIKPDDHNVVFMGGNNLYRTLTGFQDTINVHIVGGYSVFGDSTYNTRLGYQHPDQQNMVFHPNDPDFMLASTDGGVHRTLKAADTIIKWTSLNNGYLSSQFYAIGIDHGTDGSSVIIGGLQDQGTYWTKSLNPNTLWKSVRGSDGAYVAVEDGGEVYYISTQYANIRRYILDNNGNNLHNVKVMPPSLPTGSGNSWLFVHPFTLDPVDNNIMYLPYGGEVWRNDNLVVADSGDLTPWMKIADVSGNVTTIAASEAQQGNLFLGTSNGSIYLIENAHTGGTKIPQLISGNMGSSAYASCIAIDPNDNSKIIAVFSNYNAISIWYTENKGQSWVPIEGNLKGDTDPGVPPSLYYIGNGPSIRWAEIIPTETGNRYFVGTSIGLYSTNLLQGDSTVWMLEGENSIGNVVVDMLDYRQSDHFLAVGTHGNGIFTTNVIPNFLDVKENGKRQLSDALSIYPNPASSLTNLVYNLTSAADVNIELFDLKGAKVSDVFTGRKESGSHSQRLNTTALNPSVYYVKFTANGASEIKRLIVR